jgi:hypothetical protein
MADVRKILIEIDADTGNVVGGIGQVNKQLDALGAKSKLATREVSKAAKAMQKDMAGSAGVAGAATAEFGRLISDLPFGLMAVTNNISQLGNMFALLVSSAGGVRKAFNVFLSTLMGPAGVLVAFQALVAILPKLVEMLKGTEAMTEKLNKAQGAAAGELKAVRDALRLNMLSFSDASNLINDLNSKYSDLNLSLGENVQLTDDSKDSLDELIESMEKAARVKAAMTLVSDLYQEQLEQEIFLEKIRNDELTGFPGWLENVNQQFFAIGANPYLGVLAPFFDEGEGKELRVQLLEKGLNGTKQQIEDILKIVGEEGLIETLFEGKKGKDGRQAYFMLTPEEQKYFETLKELQREVQDEEFNLRERNLQSQLNNIEDIGDARVEKTREIMTSLYNLEIERLEEQKRRELENVFDPELRKQIIKKYDLMFNQVAVNFRDKLSDVLIEPIDVKLKPAVTGEDLIEGTETFAQKWARGQVNAVADAASEELQQRVDSEGERNIFVDMFGISQEKFEETAKQVQQGLNATFDLIDAQFERELALDERKTIALNDQLRERLRNEELTAEARDKINQEIAKNDAELVEKENEIEKKRFQLNKAQGVANAIVNTALGVSQALSTANIPLATFIGALGAAQVATIMAQTFTPKAMPSPNLSAQGTGAEGGLSPAFNVVGASQIDQLSAAVEMAMSKQPIKSYVVSSDVTTAQQLERNIVQGASI